MSILAGILSASRNYTEKQLKRILEIIMYPDSTAPGTLTNVKSSSIQVSVLGTLLPINITKYVKSSTTKNRLNGSLATH